MLLRERIFPVTFPDTVADFCRRARRAWVAPAVAAVALVVVADSQNAVLAQSAEPAPAGNARYEVTLNINSTALSVVANPRDGYYVKRWTNAGCAGPDSLEDQIGGTLQVCVLSEAPPAPGDLGVVLDRFRLLAVADVAESDDLEVVRNIFPGYAGAAHTVTLKTGYDLFGPRYSADGSDFAVGESDGVVSILAANAGAAAADRARITVSVPFSESPPVGEDVSTAPLRFEVTVRFNLVAAPSQDVAAFDYRHPGDPAPVSQVATLRAPDSLPDSGHAFGPGIAGVANLPDFAAAVTLLSGGRVSILPGLAAGDYEVSVQYRNPAALGELTLVVPVVVSPAPFPDDILNAVVLPENRAIVRRAADGFTGTTFVTIAAEADAPDDVELHLPQAPPDGFSFSAASVLVVNDDNPVRTGEPTVATVTAVARHPGFRPAPISILVSIVPLRIGHFDDGGELNPETGSSHDLATASDGHGVQAQFGIHGFGTGIVCEKAGEEDVDGNEIAPPGLIAVNKNCGVTPIGMDENGALTLTHSAWQATIYLVSAYISHPDPAVLLGTAVQKIRLELLDSFDYNTIRPADRRVQLAAELGHTDVIHRIVPPTSADVSYDLLNAPAVDVQNPVPLVAYEEPFGNSGTTRSVAVFGHSVATVGLHQLTVTIAAEHGAYNASLQINVTTTMTLEVEVDYHPVSLARDGDGALVPQEFAFVDGQRGVVGTLQAPDGIPDFVSNRRFRFMEPAPGWAEMSTGGEIRIVADPPAEVVDQICPVGTPRCDDPMRQIRLDARLYSPNFVVPPTATRGSIPVAARITLVPYVEPPAIAPTVFGYDADGGAGVIPVSLSAGHFTDFLRTNRNPQLAPIKITSVGQLLTLTRRDFGGQNELVRYSGIRRGLHILQVEQNSLGLPPEARTPLIAIGSAAEVCDAAGPDWRLPEYEEAAGLLNDGTSVDFPETDRHPEYAPGETLALNPVASSDIPALSGLTLAVSLYAPGTRLPAANPLNTESVLSPAAVRLNVACVAEADPDNYNRPPLRAVASFSPPSAEAKILPPVPAFLSTLASAKLSAVRSAAAGQSADHSAAAEVSLVANPGNAFALSDDDGEVKLVLQTRTYDPGTVAVTVVAEARAGLGPVARWEVAVSKLEYESEADPQFYFAGQPVASVGAVVPVQARSQLSDTRENIVAYMKYGGERRGLHFMSLESALSENDRKLEAAYDCAVARLQAGETGPGNCVFAALGVGPDADLSQYYAFNELTDLPQSAQDWMADVDMSLTAHNALANDVSAVRHVEETLLRYFQGVREFPDILANNYFAYVFAQNPDDPPSAATSAQALATLNAVWVEAGSPEPYDFPDDRVPTTALPDGFQHPLCEAMNSGDSSGLHQWRVPTLAELAGLAAEGDAQTETRIASSGVIGFPGADAGATLQLSGPAGANDAGGLDIRHLYFADFHGRGAKRVLGTTYHRAAPVLINRPLNDNLIEIMGLEGGVVPLDAKPVCVRAVSPGSYVVPPRLAGVEAESRAFDIAAGSRGAISDRKLSGTIALLTVRAVRYERTGRTDAAGRVVEATLISDDGYESAQSGSGGVVEVALLTLETATVFAIHEMTLRAGLAGGVARDVPLTVRVTPDSSSASAQLVAFFEGAQTDSQVVGQRLLSGANPDATNDAGIPVLLLAAARPVLRSDLGLALLLNAGADLDAALPVAHTVVHNGVTVTHPVGGGVAHLAAGNHRRDIGLDVLRVVADYVERTGGAFDFGAALPNGDTALDIAAETSDANGDPRPITDGQRDIARFLHLAGVRCARDTGRELCGAAAAAVDLPFPRYLAKMRAFVTVDAEDYAGRGAVFAEPDESFAAMMSVRGFAAVSVRSVAQNPGARLAIQRRIPSLPQYRHLEVLDSPVLTVTTEYMDGGGQTLRLLSVQYAPFVFTLTANLPDGGERDVVFRPWDDPMLLVNICQETANARGDPDAWIPEIRELLRRGTANLGYSCNYNDFESGTHRTPLHVAIEETRVRVVDHASLVGDRTQMGPVTMSFYPHMVTLAQMLAEAPGTDVNAPRYNGVNNSFGSPLVLAARRLRLLGDRVFNRNDRSGVTNKDLVDIVRILRDQGADPNLSGVKTQVEKQGDADRGWTFLHLASYYWYLGMGPVIEEFIRERPRDIRDPIRADINTVDRNGNDRPNTAFLDFMARNEGVHWQGADTAAREAARDAERARIISAVRAAPNVVIPAE